MPVWDRGLACRRRPSWPPSRGAPSWRGTAGRRQSSDREITCQYKWARPAHGPIRVRRTCLCRATGMPPNSVRREALALGNHDALQAFLAIGILAQHLVHVRRDLAVDGLQARLLQVAVGRTAENERDALGDLGMPVLQLAADELFVQCPDLEHDLGVPDPGPPGLHVLKLV